MSNDASGTMIGDGQPSIIVRQTQEQFPIAFLNTPLLLAWSLIGSLLTVCQVQAAGLEFIFIPTPGAAKTESRLRKNSSMAERYLPYSIDSLQLIDFVARTEGIETIEIRFEPNLHFSSQLERHSLLSDNFKLVLETDEGTQNIAPHLAQTYQGVIIDDQGSSVRLTIAANYFAGFIKTGDGDSYFIEMEVPSSPLPGADLAVRLYQPELGVGSGQGRVEDFSNVPAWYPQTDESQTTAEYSDTSIYEAEIALIADYAAYAKVNSISLLANEILNILNYTDAYYSQLNIAYRLVEIVIFTSPEVETWPETMDAGELLSAVDQWIAGGGMSNWHDLATFWTGRNFGYSYAWLNTIGDYGRHHLVEFWGTGDTRWLASFQAHEAGHNWGAQHVEDDRRWIMSPRIYSGVLSWHGTTQYAFPGYISQAIEYLDPVDSVANPTFLFYQPTVINDANQNGLADPGESFDVQLDIENIGSGTSNNTVVHLSLGGTGIAWTSIANEYDTVGSIEPFSIVSASHSFSIDAEAPIPEILVLNYSISDGTVSGSANFKLNIGRVPEYRFTVAGIDDDGNVNGKFDPNEQISLVVDVENQGEVNGFNISITLQPVPDSRPYIEDADSIRIIDRLEPGELRQIKFDFHISNDCPVGTELGFTIALSDSFNALQRLRSFVVGIPPRFRYWEDFEYFGLGSTESEWVYVQNENILPIAVFDSIQVHDEDNGEWVSSSHGGHRALFLSENWIDSGPGDVRLIMPRLDLRTAQAPKLHFKELRGWDNYWPVRKAEHQLWIESATNPTGPWSSLISVNALESDFQNWQSVENLDLSSLVGEQVYLSFHTNTHYYYWRLDDIAVTEGKLMQVVDSPVPVKMDISQNYPNPFNSKTRIEYSLPLPTNAKLTVYDIRGEEIISLVNKHQPAGLYVVYWDGINQAGSAVSAGVYFCRLQTSYASQTIKMINLK